MATIDSSVYDDPKISETLTLLSQGKSKEEIYTHFGNKNWSSVDMYFRRRGFRWNGETFAPQEEVTRTTALEDATFLPTKAALIVRQMNQKSPDIRQIALKNGFANMDELGEYMKSQGYVWDSEINNYEYDETMKVEQQAASQKESSIDFGEADYQQLLNHLMIHKERLFELLESDNTDGTLPRFKFKGSKANKTLGLPTSLQTLLHDYSQEYNVTQRAIIEIALAEFFKKYGYKEQLFGVLQA